MIKGDAEARFMKIFILILGFILFVKCFFFWLWLWQLKEYHLGRFRAHFESQAMRKIFSSFWRLKFPKFTQKIIVISFSGVLLAALITYFIFSLPDKDFYLTLLVLIFFAPLISSLVVLFFQLPTVILRHRILQKAKRKRAQVDELRSSSPSLGSPCAPRSVFKDLLVVGITGSYGKTSVKEFLATVLAEKYKVLKTKEHQNSEMGISQCILNDLKPEHEIFIVEMGAYNKGGIKLLCDIAKPKIGMVTGVNEQHLALFGTMENLLSAEGGGELIESLPEDGIIFLNAKNKYCREFYEKPLLRPKIKKLLYGEDATFAGGENILGAMAVAKELGMTDEEISKGIEKIENKFPGIQIKKARLLVGRGINVNIIDATYSANPDGVMAHLEYLKTFPGRKVIIMPCLIELGKASKEVHRRIGKKIAEICDLAIITTKDRFKEIKEEAGEKVIFMENPKEIFEKIKTMVKEGDTVLLESRVPNQLIKQLIGL